MTLKEATDSIKKGILALFVEPREQEEFSYVRDIDELTQSTTNKKLCKNQHLK